MLKPPEAKAAMLIRRPPEEVFRSFVDPKMTTKFWFTKSSGKLELGKTVVWEWEMYGASTEVEVKELENNRRIVIEWPDYKGRPNTVEWDFAPYDNGTTYVTITARGFQGSDEEVVSQALDSKGGFTWVLAGLKSYLEHGIELNLTGDAYPKGLKGH